MNDEENNQEQQEQNTLEKKIVDEGKNVAKQGSKMAAKKIKAKIAVALAPAIPFIAAFLAGIILLTFIAGALYSIYDAMSEKLSNINDNIKLAVEITDDGIVVNPKQLLKNIDDQLEALGLQKEALYLGNENQADAYLYKYMVASLSTQLPYIDTKNVTLKKLIDIASYVRPVAYILDSLDQEQEVQGIVKIMRCAAGSDTPKELQYLPYGKSSEEDSNTEAGSTEENKEQVISENQKKTFSQLIEENSSDALNYFSIDENWMLCVAKYQQITVSGASSENTYTISEVKIPYQTMVQNYSIPFSFFLTLQQMTHNPEYVSAVADMVMDGGEIEVVLYDTKETTTNVYTRKYDEIIKEWVEVPVQTGDGANENNENTGTGDGENSDSGSSNSGTTEATIPNAPPTPSGGTKPTISDRANIKRIATTSTIVNDGAGGGTQTPPITNAPNEGESGTTGETGETSEGTTTEGENETTWELQTTGPIHHEETTTTVIETNTITANVTKANVWVISHTAEYKQDNPEPEYPLGEDGTTVGPENQATADYPPEVEGTYQVNIYETTKETNVKKGWKLTKSETKIEPDEFLGMWKNKFGIYTNLLNSSFDPNGKLVTYSLPKQTKGKEETAEDETETPKRDIKSSSPAEVLLSAKDMFLTILENRENTRNACKNNERTYKLL